MESIQKGQPLNKEEAKSNDQPDSQVAVTTPGAVTINVFFDGTGNNMFNTEARLKSQHTELAEETSYGNYYSNIALLYMASTDVLSSIANIYIEGSGTFKYEEDTNYGLGLSQGDSGVYARVKEAFAKAEIARKQLKAKKINFNVFGFSRGAFYARYFCAMAKTNPKLEMDEYGVFTASGQDSLNSGRHQLKIEPKDIIMNFVGIYDTVSSHGIKHYNDVRPFKLNIGKKQKIRKIVHLTAQNDYRNHFPLTHIDTAASEGIGFECSLPGAHSDIGGAYCHDWHETQYISTRSERTVAPKKEGEVYWQWFANMGYYQGEPVHKSRAPDKNTNYKEQLIFTVRHIGRGITSNQVYANRKFTSNSYQFIPLQILKEITTKETPITFTNPKGKGILEKDIATIDNFALLKKFRDYAKNYVLQNYTKSGTQFMVKAGNTLSSEEQKQLYNQFIHNSLGPDTIANGSDSRNRGPKRIEIRDNT